MTMASLINSRIALLLSEMQCRVVHWLEKIKRLLQNIAGWLKTKIIIIPFVQLRTRNTELLHAMNTSGVRCM